MSCLSYTYHEHTNAFGPRALLAAVIMALHPQPSQTSLLPAIQPNLAQICRWWVAKSIITKMVDCDNIGPFFQMDITESNLANLFHLSVPYDLAMLLPLSPSIWNNHSSHLETLHENIHTDLPTRADSGIDLVLSSATVESFQHDDLYTLHFPTPNSHRF